MHRAAGVVVVVVDWRGQRKKPFCIAYVRQIKIQVFAPRHFLAAPHVRVCAHQIGAVKLVPHHAVVKARRLLHQSAGEFFLCHKAHRQKAECLEFRQPLRQLLLFIRQKRVKLRFLFRLVRHNAVIRRNDEIGVVILRTLNEELCRKRLQCVVRVHKLQIFAPRHAHAEVPRRRNAGVFLINQNDARVCLREHLAHRVAHVLRAVVQKQYFKIFIRLPPNALHAAHNVVLRVVDRHDHADKRFLHQNTSFPASCSVFPYFTAESSGRKDFLNILLANPVNTPN